MTEFKKGQRVKVEYEGVVTSVSFSGLTLQLAVNDGDHLRYVDTGRKELRITIVDPKGWPPQVGDIWEAEGAEWFARQNYASPDQVVIIAAEPGQSCDDYYQDTQDQFKALSPILVRRRGE